MAQELLSLFGPEFDIQVPEAKPKKEKEIINKIVDAEKVLKSKKISLLERLAIITENVYRILGKQKDNVIVIRNRADFHAYIDAAIKSGRIAIDTETNNSLDPVTCKIAGLCLYYPGGKQAYIPINHRDPVTKERLPWQCTEQDVKEELERVNESGIEQEVHNGKFDYETLEETCDIRIQPTWDSMVGARLINENELAGLKPQYITKIDKNQVKYDIEGLFEGVSYLDVDPEVFALYAATDSFMTDKLCELQKIELAKDTYGPHLDMTGKRMLPGIRWLFHEVEMPITTITGDMELTGVCVDTAFGERLKIKYTELLDQLDIKVNNILKTVEPIVNLWRLEKSANEKVRIYVPKKTKMAQEKIELQYPLIDENGERYKVGKTKAEQLDTEINLSSPAQLAILFYDVLQVEVGGSINRKTGKDELKDIKEKLNGYIAKLDDDEPETDEGGELEEAAEMLEKPDDVEKDKKWAYAAQLAELLLKRRELAKLITTYIDVIPDLVKHWPDGRIRFHLNALGTDTGRYSSGGKLKFMENEEPVVVSGINIQNIPSRGSGKICRLLFRADEKHNKVEETNNCFVLNEIDEVETTLGWKYPVDLTTEDSVISNEGVLPIISINKINSSQYRIMVR